MLLGLDVLLQFLPLVELGVLTRRVVSARVQKDDRLVGSAVDVVDEPLPVETVGGLVVVAVVLDLEPGVGEERNVVGPCRGGDKDLLVMRVETVQEVSRNPQRTGAGERLNSHHLFVDDVLRVFAEGKLDGGLVEAGVAHDAQVLMVLLTLIEALLEVASGLANGGQNVGLVVVVPVGADTKVHLLGAGVLVEGQRNAQDGVLRTLGHVRPY